MAAKWRSASAKPTADDRPWPSGPVVTSMPSQLACGPASGWPGVLEPTVRNALRSSSVKWYPLRCNTEYNNAHAWPLDSTKRSRLIQRACAGSCLRNCVYSVNATGAMPIGAPGWPLLAFCTMSAASTRRPLMTRAVLGSSSAVGCDLCACV